MAKVFIASDILAKIFMANKTEPFNPKYIRLRYYLEYSLCRNSIILFFPGDNAHYEPQKFYGLVLKYVTNRTF